MHLNQIKIQGFKSFAEHIDLTLEPGVTAIVGPNGCGKSNVSDAIRWVLGEQSARALRCANMQDILFNGGADFKPAQKTKVSLQFTNTEGKLSLESPEIEISRQLTRDGDSRYLINENPCLLRDITELFMDTGIGVSAYSVMEQSKIDLILNTRAEERRFLFDEVAGITKYKHRKKTALKKLQDTEQNLLRINDVILELQRETESLKRQAEQAQHHQHLQEQLKTFELNQSRREYERFVKDLSETQGNLDELLNLVNETNNSMQSAEQESEELTERRNSLDADIVEGQKVASQFTSQIERTERQIALYQERQLNLQEQRHRAMQAIESFEKQSADLEKQKRELAQERTQLQATLKLEESRLTARQRVLTEFATRINESKESIRGTEAEQLEVTSQAADLESELASLESRLEYATGNLHRITENSKLLEAQLNEVRTSHAEARQCEQRLKADLVRLDTENQKVEEELHQRQDSLRKLESEMRGTQDSLGMSVSRLKSLKELQSAYEGFYAGVRAIMTIRETEPYQFGGVCGVIAELIRTDSQYELAIEVALGSAIQNVVTETAEDAQKGIAFLKKSRAGRVTFLPLDMLRARSFRDADLLKQQGVVGLASDLVNYEPKYDIAVQQLLGNALVIENLDTAIQLARRFRPNARLVTLEGEVINTSGAVTGGSSNSQTSGFLSRPRELEQLQEKIDKLTAIVNRKESQRTEHVGRLAELQQTRETLSSQRQKSQIEYAGHVKDSEQHGQRIAQLQRELTEVQTESGAVREEAEKVGLTRESNQAKVEDLQKQRTKLQNRIKRLTEQVQSESNKHDEVVISCQELEISLHKT